MVEWDTKSPKTKIVINIDLCDPAYEYSHIKAFLTTKNVNDIFNQIYTFILDGEEVLYIYDIRSGNDKNNNIYIYM